MQHKGGLTGKSIAEEKEKDEKTTLPTSQRKDIVQDEEMNELADSLHKH